MDSYLAAMQRYGVPAESMVIGWDFDPGLIGRLAYKFREYNADAVHTHLIHADLHGIIAAKCAGVGHIFLTGHNDDRFRRRLPIRLVQGWLWRQVDAGITISEALRQFVINVEFAPPDRVHTVHYGLDAASVQAAPDARARLCQELGLPTHAPLVGSVCRLIEQKGLTYAIRAFWQIAEQAGDAHYVIAGDGPLRPALQQEAKGFGIDRRVHFLGWRDDPIDLLAAFDVLLIPSLWEGFGLIALEAMAASTPIIASRVSALPEIVEHGVTGYLVPPADPMALAENLLDVIRNPDQARQMGINGRRRLESEFSAERMVDSTLKVYQSA